MGGRDDMRMPDVLIPPSLMVIVLGMLASIGWGAADFGGGLSSRTAPVLGVRPKYPGKRPPYNSSVPCYKSKIPNVNGPAGAGGPGEGTP